MFANLDGKKSIDAYDACRRVFLLTTQLKPRCKYADTKVERISAWSVGQHIEHVLAVNAKTVLILSRDKSAMDLTAVVPASAEALAMLAGGIIPRGKAVAHDSVLPKMNVFVDLADDVERNTGLLDDLTVIYRSIAADDALYPHPILGGLTKMQWLRFLEIHIEHHMKIISDIVGEHRG